MRRAKGLVLTVGLFLSLFAASQPHAQTKKWSDIDCAKLEMALPGATKCWTTASYAGPDGRSSYIEQTASFANGSERAYAYVNKPYVALSNGGINVTSEAREKYLSRPSPDAGKSGTNFSATLKVANGYAKTFALPSGWQCFSFVKDAPPGGETYGVAFYLAGYDCKKAAGVPAEKTMTDFIQSVSVKR